MLLPAPGPPGLVQEPRQRQEGQGAESPGPPLGERPRPRLLLLRALLQRPRVRRRVRAARLKRGQRLPIRQGEVENGRNKGFASYRPAAATVLGCHTVAAATVLAEDAVAAVAAAAAAAAAAAVLDAIVSAASNVALQYGFWWSRLR